MAGTFFGFDTNLPSYNNVASTGLNAENIVDEDEDSKNDETFNVSIPASMSPMKQLGENDPNLDIVNKKTSNNGLSVRDMLLEEYDPLAGIITREEELEEEEIIENSISQLGLDDEVEDKHIKRHPDIEDNGSWPTPAKSDAMDGSAIFIQDLLSPDRRGIWTSPQSSDKSLNSPQQSNNGKSDILKDIFGVQQNNTKNEELESEVHKDLMTMPIKAIRAEDLEKGLTSSSGSHKDEERTPVIIERRIPRTPAPPPGFLFPMGTPPSGLPWMTPPGMMPLPPMLSGQMQRMLAASPRMALFNGMGMQHWPRGGRMPGHSPFMPNSPQQRDRYYRPQQPQRRREMGNSRGYGNTQMRQWNRRDDNRYHSTDYEDEMIKLPPSDLMTSREKEWLVKIQLMTLLSGDMQTTDFYYISYMSKKASQQTEALEKDETKSENEAENLNKLLDIVEQKKEERKYRPVVFHGSLGKLTVATIHHPRQLMDLSAKDQEEDDPSKSKSNEGTKKRFIIYGIIEKAYSVLLTISDIERRLSEMPQEGREDLVNERIVKIDELFSSMKLSVDDWQRDKVNELFLQIMCIAKGKKLLLRALPHFDLKYKEIACLSVLSAIQLLIKKDIHDKILPQFLVLLKKVVYKCSADFLSKLPAALAFNNLSHLITSSLGLDLFILLWEHIQLLTAKSNLGDFKDALTEWDSLRRNTTIALTQISPKNLEKHPAEIVRLKELLLHEPKIAFEE